MQNVKTRNITQCDKCDLRDVWIVFQIQNFAQGFHRQNAPLMFVPALRSLCQICEVGLGFHGQIHVEGRSLTFFRFEIDLTAKGLNN